MASLILGLGKLGGGGWSALCSNCFTPREWTFHYHWVGGWVAQEPVCTCLAKKEFRASARNWTADHPARSLVNVLTMQPYLLLYSRTTVKLFGNY